MATPGQSTLLDLVQAVNAYAASEEEVVATVAYLINSGKVLLCGNFAGAKIDLPASLTAPLSLAPSPPAAKPPTSAALSEAKEPSLGSRAVIERRQQGGWLPYLAERRARAMT